MKKFTPQLVAHSLAAAKWCYKWSSEKLFSPLQFHIKWKKTVDSILISNVRKCCLDPWRSWFDCRNIRVWGLRSLNSRNTTFKILYWEWAGLSSLIRIEHRQGGKLFCLFPIDFGGIGKSSVQLTGVFGPGLKLCKRSKGWTYRYMANEVFRCELCVAGRGFLTCMCLCQHLYVRMCTLSEVD